jgi:16S rRNA (cytosine1402-N4)-methyltransferase
MSYGPEPASGFFARDVLNRWSETAIADVLFGYGGERYARRIAKAVVERRKFAPFTTTFELVELVRDAVPAGYRHGKLHCATRTFQALRIAVNDELRVLESGLKAAWEHLSCNGRIAVITFHSIEDRIVKQRFAAYAKAGGRVLFKKPQTPSRAEIISNPAARSAKLRAIEKVCKK